jgi:D-3-phosphoglycerate dehydrogenase
MYQKSDLNILKLMNLAPENRYFINREQRMLMQPTAYLIHCARGELVHTADLVEALQKGGIAGYAADVLDREPPEQDDPLIRSGLENVILAPSYRLKNP